MAERMDGGGNKNGYLGLVGVGGFCILMVPFMEDGSWKMDVQLLTRTTLSHSHWVCWAWVIPACNHDQ